MANVYRVVYEGSFCDKSGDEIFIEFLKRMDEALPVPVPEQIIFAGEDQSPIVISYKEDSQYKMTPITGSEAIIKIKAIEGFELASMFAKDEREWKVDIFGAWKWQGFVIPDDCSEPFESYPYDVTIRATDMLGTLKDVPYLDSIFLFEGFSNDVTVLNRALSFTGLSLNLLIAVNTLEETMDTSGLFVDPLYQTYIDNSRFKDADGKAFSCEEVIRSIVQRWGCRLRQFDYKWQLVNVLEESRGPVPARIFTPESVFSENVILGNTITAGGQDRDLRPVGSTITCKALASSTAYYQYGYIASKLYNGNFNTYLIPTTLPDGWEGYAGAVWHAESRENDANDRHIVITGTDAADSVVRSTHPVQIRAGETVSISFDLKALTAVIGNANRYIRVQIKDQFGNFFTKNGWQGSGFYEIKTKGTEFTVDMSIRFDLDVRDDDYQLTIGFKTVADGASQFATSINNVEVRPSAQSAMSKAPVGSFNTQTSVTNQSYRRDPILILHCDELNDQRTSRIFINNIVPTTEFKWSRSGYTESLHLLKVISNSELTAHQRPYRIFEGEFIGYGSINVNTLLTIDLINADFIFMSGDFDLKKSVHNLRFAEALTEPMGSSDVTGFDLIYDDYGGTKDKNGNSVGVPSGVNPPPTGGYIIDLSPYAKKTDLPVKATNVETQTGTDDDKFVTPLKLSNWWSWIKTQVQTISSLWNFTTRPTYNGNGLITLSDVPAESDTLQTVTSRGSSTTTGASFIGNVGAGLSTPLTKLHAKGVLRVERSSTANTYIDISAEPGAASINGKNIASAVYLQMIFNQGNNLTDREVGRFDGNGVLTLIFAPTSANHAVRLQDLIPPITNESITATQTSASLNTAYPSAKVNQIINYPGVGTGMMYIKNNTTGGGQWHAWATTSI